MIYQGRSGFPESYTGYSGRRYYLRTFNVVDLYTTIPTELGIEAVKFWTEKPTQ